MIKFRQILSLFLALNFLVAGLGYSVNKMICLKSGKQQISFVEIKDCCPENPSETVSSHCCDIINTDFDLSDFSSDLKLPDYKPQVVLLPGLTDRFQLTSHRDKPLALHFSNGPPLETGRQLLTFISVFRI